MNKVSRARVVVWIIVVAATFFVCHASRRLLVAAKNQPHFHFHEGLATFSELGFYAFYLQTPSAYNACINRLRQMDGAIQQWALEKGKKPDDKVTWNDIMPYLRNERLQCPHGGLYILSAVSNAPKCTIPDHKLLE